jgi:O-antigen ligase
MSAHGVISTLMSFFEAGSSDDSVKARLVDYPYVAQLVNQSPWLGHGGGTYMPENTTYILDNQWLKTAVENGFLGIIALAVYFAVPLFAALITRWHTNDPDLRLLCAALAGPVLAASVCSFTFDSLSFATFSNVYALVIGIIGACWRMTARAERLTAERALGSPATAGVSGKRPAMSINTVQSAGG